MQLNGNTLIHFVLSGMLLCSCAPGNVPTKPGRPTKPAKSDTLKDNISDFRPRYDGTAGAARPATTPATAVPPAGATAAAGAPTGDITAKLNVILDTIAIRNRNIRFAQGYRVQIYTGTNREEATKARNRSYARFPDVTPHFDYTQPNFRVRVGDFLDRLEAQRVYAGLLAEFPNALIVPDRIEIR
jgi:hypothetical protein